MSDSFFRTRDEELTRLNHELAELKTALREIGERLGQIERHVKRAFGIKEAPRGDKGKPKTKDPDTEAPSISPDGALVVFRELTELTRDKGSTAAESRLELMSLADLRLLARELGVSFPSKPSRKSLQAGVRGRITESLMLSRNRNVTDPASEQTKVPDRKP
jgi:hypothetical protein